MIAGTNQDPAKKLSFPASRPRTGHPASRRCNYVFQESFVRHPDPRSPSGPRTDGRPGRSPDRSPPSHATTRKSGASTQAATRLRAIWGCITTHPHTVRRERGNRGDGSSRRNTTREKRSTAIPSVIKGGSTTAGPPTNQIDEGSNWSLRLPLKLAPRHCARKTVNQPTCLLPFFPIKNTKSSET